MIETLIGLGLGLGHATRLRFLGPIGPSELLLSLGTVLLLKKNYKAVFSFTLDLKGFLKFCIFLTIYIIAPIQTILTLRLTNYEKSTPVYIVAFMAAYAFMFSLVESYKNGSVNLKKLVSIYAVTYISLNIFLYFFPITNVYYSTLRFEGLAKNPNQLGFYGAALAFVSLITFESLIFKFIVTMLVVLIGYLSKSDAMILATAVSIVVYLMFKIFSCTRLSSSTKFLLIVSLILVCSWYVWCAYKDYIIFLWYQADEGAYLTGGRLALWKNAVRVILNYALFGLGYGSFSGYAKPYEGEEAHNTVLDLGVQFGVIFDLCIYSLLIYSVFHFFKKRRYDVSATLVGFIVLGLFHFYARHFDFWFILSLLYYYVFVYDASTFRYIE